MQKILGAMRKLCEDYQLIENGDKIAVGISGGKDSLTLLTAMKRYQSFSKQQFDLIAIAIDLSGGKMNYHDIQVYCKNLGVEFYLIPSDVFDIVFEKREEKNPCSLCANMRRGLLNSTAKELGCNKVALGHHQDDLIETFILSLFFEGRLSTFKPATYLSKMDITAIRPLLYCSETDILRVSKDMPVLENICPVNHHTEREGAKLILADLNKKYPDAKKKIFNAIIHKERYNLFNS